MVKVFWFAKSKLMSDKTEYNCTILFLSRLYTTGIDYNTVMVQISDYFKAVPIFILNCLQASQYFGKFLHRIEAKKFNLQVA